ncbi:MAG: hypothetical protein O7A98_04825 [Acidobacteria bacterium]|nr:hypothetical protein [Acidobacteriota bacterium]
MRSIRAEGLIAVDPRSKRAEELLLASCPEIARPDNPYDYFALRCYSTVVALYESRGDTDSAALYRPHSQFATSVEAAAAGGSR